MITRREVEEIKEAVSVKNGVYGKWGALNPYQRIMITRLCNSWLSAKEELDYMVQTLGFCSKKETK